VSHCRKLGFEFNADCVCQYVFVLSSALSTGIAISGVLIFFAIQWSGVRISWWGTKVSYMGCEAQADPCRLFKLEKGEYFGPAPGQY
jgi:hypothetical protein